VSAAAPHAPVLEDLSFDMPGAVHEVHLEPTAKRVRAIFDGVAIADSLRVKLMRETGRLPVYYFPVEDVRFDLLVPGSRSERSPYKGEATYLTIDTGKRRSHDAAWRPAVPTCPGSSPFTGTRWIHGSRRMSRSSVTLGILTSGSTSSGARATSRCGSATVCSPTPAVP
jgi:uncharacterized protein (DUF427 family)